VTLWKLGRHVYLLQYNFKVPPERDGNYNKPEFVQPQEETLMSIVLN